MGRIKQIRSLLKTNIIKTLWLNFKMLPFKQAVRVPIFVYGKVHFRSLKGRITIIRDVIFPGMIHIGDRSRYVSVCKPESVWTLEGEIVFHGIAHFYQGTYVLVAKNGVLSFGKRWTIIGSGSKIMCFDQITLGENVRIAWECQLMDTSFHYICSVSDPTDCKPLTKPIVIGNDIWIGNRTTIARGTILPDSTIVASNSLVNKDFSQNGPNCLLAGSPAKVVRQGMSRVWDDKKQAELDQQFGYSRVNL